MPQDVIDGTLTEPAKLLSSICADYMEYSLNNNQLGVSLAAAWMMQSKKALQ